MTPPLLLRTPRRAPFFALFAAASLLLAAEHVAAATYLLDVPARLQYEENGGYCGELTLQQLMLPFGVWLPQQFARDAGGGELLPGVNYVAAMDKLKIRYNTFPGSGGSKAFFAWAKKQLMGPVRAGVVSVVYLKGLSDRQYDHIIPFVGLDTASPPSSYVYAPADVLTVNTGFSTKAVKRSVSGYSCTWRAKNATDAQGGCVPSDTKWGYSVLGPTYAGIGPRVTLSVPRSSEPGPAGSAGVKFDGTLKVSGLQIGGRYKVFKVTDVSKVPSGAALSGLLAPGDLLTSFTAAAADWTTAVSFTSNVPAWFICVVA